MTLPRALRIAPLALLLAACNSGAGTSGGSVESEELVLFNDARPMPPPAPVRGMQDLSAPAEAPQRMQQERGPAPAPGAPANAAATDTVAIPAMIIRTGHATVEVDSLEPAVARVRQLAQRVGGYVANTSQRGGERETRQATLELKIPARRFDEALRGLAPLGEVESVNVSTQDVGEEFVDVTARVTNSRRLEERLLGLLANRTGRLEDVLAVERELARVREEIERHEGRLRYLRTRVAVSTLTVSLHEPHPVVGDYPGANPILSAFSQAWRNFVGFVAAFIASLGILVPLGVILWLLWLVLRRLRRRRRPVPPPPPADAPQT
ncbi:MAG TPA: DUF4349 domain-containing protein [Longimicrobiaceae bacterium]|nr:DUF4349 domain-containing protein [Longimicrobiaceae bacterium]